MSGRPDGPWFPHGPTSRAVLIGTGRFTGLPAIPSVAANLRGLWAALTHPDHGLLAPEHMSDPADLAVGQLDLAGTYTLTSTTRTAPSHAPEGETYTAFTGALLDALAEPVPLTLDEVHGRVDRALHSRGLPRPQRRSAGAAGSLVLLRGPSGVPGAARGAGPTAPPPPRTPPPPPSGPPPFQMGAPVPPPRSARRRRPVLIAAAVGGALAVLLTSSLVKGWFTDDGGGFGKATDGTVSGGTNTPDHTGGSPNTGLPGAISPTPHAPRPAVAAKVVYRDRRVVWRAPSCTGSISQALDLDTPAVTAQTVDTSGGTTLDYIGCQNGINGAQAVITLAASYGSPIRAGTADARTDTGEACRAAAEGSPLGPNTNAGKIPAGTVWCVVTKLNQVARVTFSKVDTSDTSSGAGPGNPTFELTVTLWAAP
ncbi:hypothetical protein ACFVFQ_29550 [Streptomyces sp. NPDC057743]|uniref:hypothetical protein n=1 Tax=Streptomyces sp. NPDC057743 TaxID=3346236 RepID=UPI0036B1DCFC